MGKNFMDAETNGNVVKDAMIKLGKGMSFIMKFDNDEFESMFLDECIFYHKELDVSNEDGIYRVSDSFGENLEHNVPEVSCAI